MIGLQRWRRDRRCSVSVEFAVVALVMVVLFLGTIEIVNALRVQAKVNVVSGQLAEFVAEQTTAYESTGTVPTDQTGYLADMCKGGSYDMAPYNIGLVSAAIGSLSVTGTSNNPVATLSWESDKSCPSNAANLGAAQMITYANPLLTAPGHGLVLGYAGIVVLVSYRYYNVLPYFLAQYIPFTSLTIVRPRDNVLVPCFVGNTTTACPTSD